MNNLVILSAVGHAKNEAVKQSMGRFLCFQDVVSKSNILYKAVILAFACGLN